jgi:hypothetical protein
MNKEEREKALKDYQERYGEHHPICTCPQCLEIRRKEPKLKTLWRLFMFGTAAKAPRVYVREKDKYVCPECLEEKLSYDEEERLFTCSNEKCGKKFALSKIEA